MPNFFTRTFAKLTLDELIYQSRWLLYPVNIGLLIASIIYMLRFLWQAGRLVIHAPANIFANDDSDLLISVVHLLDQAMIMALLILTLMSSHQIYIRRFRTNEHDVPQWLMNIDTVMMKVKLGLAFVGYSSAKLLEDIITKAHVSQEDWMRHIVTHLVFLSTTLIAAIVWRIIHPTNAGGQD